MTDNPYSAPESQNQRVTGVISGSREDLRKVASAQKGILVCILVYFGMLAASAFAPNLRQVLQIGVLLLGLTSMAFVFILATRVYGTGMGIFLGILTLVPCVGLLVLLRVNHRATSIMQENGIKVGLLGAKTPI